MSCPLNVLALSIAVCSLMKGVGGNTGAEVQQVDNAEQFALLCRIYNVAKNPPINHVDLQDPNKIVEEINALNASFAEEKTPNETDESYNSSYTTLKPSTAREAAVAVAILSLITKKAHTILEDIRKVSATTDIENAKLEFAQVIFGEGGNESHLCEGALKDVGDRATACGLTGLTSKGASAGKNLVVDFFCLCAMRTDGKGTENVCSVKVGGKGKSDYHGWGDNKGPSGSSSMWASVKKACVNLLHTHPKSIKEGHEVIEDFLTHLKDGGLYRWGTTNNNGVEGSSRKAGMLGTSVGPKEGDHGSGLVCDGKRGEKDVISPRRSGGGNTVKSGGVCVYYGPEKWEDNIDWLRKYKTALETTDAINSKTTTIQRKIEKLQMLLHYAEKIYETTKVITEIQKPQAVAAFHNATAKRLTAYNAARRYHHLNNFIIPWVLFLR
ncbi:Variant surface glycoprotein [Trypanosoma congolense IL3000]|uniref:Variant surface glycoprotein n=1 Tax=Trypanosoma congolense (strain IL3000) TaxID=1068625 RepID=F9W3L0_TRYCI|nr:Variant surface glycoprotein [Trypanosoma congolense IL3000]